MAKYYIGIDGGGSKTKYRCFDSAGREVGQALTSGTYCEQDGIPAVLERLRDGIRQCLPESCGDVLIGFGMPAFGEHKELDDAAVAAISAALHPMKVQFANDVAVGWAGALAMEPGISIVGGTGSIAYGRDFSGRAERSGGWHEFFSDEGSGYFLGKKLLQLFSWQSDGRQERTQLYHLTREHLGLKDDFDITGLVAERYAPSRKETAALQTILLQAARAGDPNAQKCYDEAADELVRIILAVLRKLDFSQGTPVTVSFQGGLFAIEDLIRRPVEEKLRLALPGRPLRFCQPRLDPSVGAVLLAVEALEPQNLGEMTIKLSNS